MVDRWTDNELRREMFSDLEQFRVAMGKYIDHVNKKQKPFIWIARASELLQKVTRTQATLNKSQSV